MYGKEVRCPNILGKYGGLINELNYNSKFYFLNTEWQVKEQLVP